MTTTTDTRAALDRLEAALGQGTQGPFALMANAEWNVLGGKGYRFACCTIDAEPSASAETLSNARLLAAMWNTLPAQIAAWRSRLDVADATEDNPGPGVVFAREVADTLRTTVAADVALWLALAEGAEI